MGGIAVIQVASYFKSCSVKLKYQLMIFMPMNLLLFVLYSYLSAVACVDISDGRIPKLFIILIVSNYLGM